MVTQTTTNRDSATSERVSQKYMLNAKQLLLLIGLGIFFWFVFAMVVRIAGGMGVFGGWIGIATFLLSIPVGWLLVVVIRKAAGLSTAQLVPGMSLCTAAAALCDGVALTWVPGLYGDDMSVVLMGAAYILWGAGVLIFSAYIMAAMEINKASNR